jgi:outer membrane protein OmpA-like peptidoglycan-associated protein
MASHDDSTSDLANSFTDLMTSLAVIFILLLVAAVGNQLVKAQATQAQIDKMMHQLAAQVRSTEDRRKKVLASLKAELPGASIEEDPNDPFGVLISEPHKLENFTFDSARLPPDAPEFLDGFAPKLAQAVCSPPVYEEVNSVIVEGHADERGTDEANLDISTRRSMAVVTECLQAVEVLSSALSAHKQDCFARLLMATGRGRRDPIETNGIEDRDRSRRVLFKIRLRTLEEKQLERRLGKAFVAQNTTGRGPLDGGANAAERP